MEQEKERAFIQLDDMHVKPAQVNQAIMGSILKRIARNNNDKIFRRQRGWECIDYGAVAVNQSRVPRSSNETATDPCSR